MVKEVVSCFVFRVLCSGPLLGYYGNDIEDGSVCDGGGGREE